MVLSVGKVTRVFATVDMAHWITDVCTYPGRTGGGSGRGGRTQGGRAPFFLDSYDCWMKTGICCLWEGNTSWGQPIMNARLEEDNSDPGTSFGEPIEFTIIYMIFITQPGSSLVGFLFLVFASDGGSGDIAGMNGVGDERGGSRSFPAEL